MINKWDVSVTEWVKTIDNNIIETLLLELELGEDVYDSELIHNVKKELRKRKIKKLKK